MGKRFKDYDNAVEFMDYLAALQEKYIEELDKLTDVVEAQGEYIKELEKKMDPLSREIESQEIMKKTIQ